MVQPFLIGKSCKNLSISKIKDGKEFAKFYYCTKYKCVCLAFVTYEFWICKLKE